MAQRTSILLCAIATALALAAPADSHAADCGDFNDDSNVTASDALGVLQTAVGGATCRLWVCDVDNSSAVTASDALRVLQSAVGQPITLDCPQDPANCVSDLDFFFSQVWTPILTDCVSCHQPGGVAGGTDHVLLPAGEPGYLEYNFEAERAFAAIVDGKNGAELLLSKPLGIAHGGGQRLGMTEGDDLHRNLEAMIARFENPVDDCGGSTDAFYDGIGYLDSAATLRKAAIVFAGRLPTPEESAAVTAGDESTLRATVRGLLAGPGFENFLREGANDKFLTNKYLSGDDNPYNAVGGRRAYPDLKKRVNEVEAELGEDAGKAANRATKDAIAREPLELVVHVVTEDRPYTEILTADYMMVNPWSNVSFGSGVVFDDDWDAEEWREGQNLGYSIPGWPHAGILTSPIWLSRFPSTSTNRNRARARWAYDFFLGFDIEGSAPRAVDRTALEDEDNPTLNNVHCTVCHEKLDPIAGAFQNFGDFGVFRPNETDALPDSYKESELYEPGDLWYRDMLSPGFNNTLLPGSEADRSLPWLAEQLIADPRFARGTVRFWFPAVFGQETLIAPTAPDDANYETRLEAWVAQDEAIGELASLFESGDAGTGTGGPFNLRDLFVEMALSPMFTAVSVDDLDAARADELAEVGLARLLTPEQLDRKLESTAGRPWTQDAEGLVHEILGRYRTFYGGIDSVGVTERTHRINPLMSTVPQRMAYEIACPLTVREFSVPAEQRVLFPLIEPDDLESDTEGAQRIRENIAYLHQRLLGEELSPDDDEVDHTLAVFADIRAHRIAAGSDTRLDRVTTCENVDFEAEALISDDPDHTVRAWMMVLIYLLGDYEFLHE